MSTPNPSITAERTRKTNLQCRRIFKALELMKLNNEGKSSSDRETMSSILASTQAMTREELEPYGEEDRLRELMQRAYPVRDVIYERHGIKLNPKAPLVSFMCKKDWDGMTFALAFVSVQLPDDIAVLAGNTTPGEAHFPKIVVLPHMSPEIPLPIRKGHSCRVVFLSVVSGKWEPVVWEPLTDVVKHLDGNPIPPDSLASQVQDRICKQQQHLKDQINDTTSATEPANTTSTPEPVALTTTPEVELTTAPNGPEAFRDVLVFLGLNNLPEMGDQIKILIFIAEGLRSDKIVKELE
ncbi:hypothetical protein B0J11DRAFT_577295 [Dendryphion nanum]|uniref:Uncharacterized protein n=1 Tax=Dendryphion nanum TaxID=256645 RepID=A0A9P9E853_9PLEO|nr:hypothetical protein B0J11DRAFT_577295 [Dendryphion nanum]